MKDLPIIFSGAMVLALLREIEKRGTGKTQTRRLASSPLAKVKPGDRLWVRETVRAEELSRPEQTRAATPRERKFLKRTEVTVMDELDGTDGVRYAADCHWSRIENKPEAGEAWSALFNYRGASKGRVGAFVPSIHMPRWASRLTLVVTEVRFERLQDISEADALAEGITSEEVIVGSACYGGHHTEITGTRFFFDGCDDEGFESAGDAFRALWESLHGAGSWDANPELVAISFECHQVNIDQMKVAA